MMIYNFLNKYKLPLHEETFLSRHITAFYYYASKYYEHKLDKKTLQVMINQIQGFEKFMFFQYPDIKTESNINENHIIAFRQFCIEGLGNTTKTTNKKLTSLKYFFKYFADKKLIKYNIVLNVSKLKLNKNQKPTIFTKENLKVLFGELLKLNHGIRDLVITKFVLTTGIKIEDILKLKVSDIDIENKLLIYNHEPYALSEEVIKSVNKYLYLREVALNKYCIDYLFISDLGNIYSIRSFQMHFKLAIANTNIPSTLSPRYLRTTFLYNMSTVIQEDELRALTNQIKLNHYYDYLKNPLQNLK